MSAVLRDLQGYLSLAHELIQNADDADEADGHPAASWIAFDVRADALVVSNDGVFSHCDDLYAARCSREGSKDGRCDFHSFRKFAGEAKRDRDGTTGAFGVGFTAVYQVTDRPELITRGVHLTLRPELPDPRDRVDVCGGCARCDGATGTRFRLPWAQAASELRRKLRVEPRKDPDGVVNGLCEHLAEALPFLRRVRRIELRRDGREVATFGRERHADH